MPYEPTGSAQDAVNADLDSRVEALASRVETLEAEEEQPVVDLTPRVEAVESSVTLLGSSLETLSTRQASDDSAQGVALAALATRVQNLETVGGSVGSAWPGYVSLRDPIFTGANDTERMRNALTVLAADTAGRRRVLILPPGTELAPGTSPFKAFSGLSIVGGIVPETEFSENCRVRITGAAPSGVFYLPTGDTRAFTIANIGFEGPGSSQICRFLVPPTAESGLPDGRLCYSLWHGLSFDNFTQVLNKRFLGFVWSGSGYCNNSTETPIITRGSDYSLWEGNKYFLDSPNLADDEYLLHIQSGNKVAIGSVFVTGDGPTPVRVSGGQMVRIHNLEMEAEGIPRKTAGAGYFQSGGNVVLDNAWFFRTMYNQASTGRGDNGVVHVAGGSLRMNNATFGEYNTTPEKPGGHTENHIYASGSSKVWAQTPLPWNMQDNSGTGGLNGARALQVAKAGTAQIFAANYTAL